MSGEKGSNLIFKVYSQNKLKLNKDILTDIANLKLQWWGRTVNKQIRYINSLGNTSSHIVGFLDKKIIAYVRLIKREIKGEQSCYKVIGVSTVCVNKSYRHYGYGVSIMKQVNTIIDEEEYDFGLLQCNESLKKFYEKCGWHKTTQEFIRVDKFWKKVNAFKENNVMIYPRRDFLEKVVDICGNSF